MNTLDRIEVLMKERGWSKYRLSKECGIALSSISNMFRRSTSPTVSTLEAICAAFGITLSQFFDVGTDTMTVQLTPEQKKMFDKWSALTDDQKDLFFRFVDNMK